MSTKKLLLLSNSTNPGEPYLQYPQAHIKNFLGPGIDKVLFIPYAGVGITYDDYNSRSAVPFAEMGYTLEGIHTHPDPVVALEQAEAVAVGGGNTFALLHALYHHNLLNILRERVASGLPYVGWSAGSNVTCPSIKTTNDMPIIQPPSFDALSLVPFQLNPHYTEERLPNHGGENRVDRLREFTELNPDLYVVGLPEGNMLRIDGDTIELIGKGTMKVFKGRNDVLECHQGDKLSFLWN